jgi:peptidoglycan/xylan/chitin deacetylase (PgdA/CDA1 family)
MKYLLALLIVTKIYSQECQQYQADLSAIKSCEGKSVHLSFDDGPNTTTTPKIVETLKRQKVKATFFVSTHQLEKGDLIKKRKILNNILDDGHTTASHCHDHKSHAIRYYKDTELPSFNSEESLDQIQQSMDLLNDFTNGRFSEQKHKLIRFPYGRGISPSRKELSIITGLKLEKNQVHSDQYATELTKYRANSPAMTIASQFSLSHVGWNHDSNDASNNYNLPNNKLNTKKYVHDQLEYICSGSTKNFMSLFHDTRAINSEPSRYDSNKTVMDELIEKGKCLGIKFVSIEKYLNLNSQDGVITKPYSAEKLMERNIKVIESPELKIPGNEVCAEADKVDLKLSKCFSDDDLKFYEHCGGSGSICIDGKWISSKPLAKLVCESTMAPSYAKEISSKYMNQKCPIASQRIPLADEMVACYCLNSGNNILRWKCSDISSGVAKDL